MKTYETTTRELYSNWMSSMTDIIWDNKEIHDLENFRNYAVALSTGDMQSIRKMFIDGYTIMLMGPLMSELDKATLDSKDIEIRVYVMNNTSKVLIGVVIDTEIIF